MSWIAQIREKDGSNLTQLLLTVLFACWNSSLWYHLSTQARKLLQSPFDFLLCIPIFCIMLASKEWHSSTVSLFLLQNQRWPLSAPPFCILMAKICHTCDSHKGILCRSLLRELSLEQPVIRTPQDAHHLPEQTQETLYGVQLSGLTVQRQMAINWLTSLRKYRESKVQAQNSRKAKGQKGSHFCLCYRKWQADPRSRKPPFHTNIDFSEHLNGWH